MAIQDVVSIVPFDSEVQKKPLTGQTIAKTGEDGSVEVELDTQDVEADSRVFITATWMVRAGEGVALVKDTLVLCIG
ncbi:hypothetical protein SARC_14422, partial [Sphaeroforma arctica JP610]